jgi:glycolate oxidase FAD binding subunit
VIERPETYADAAAVLREAASAGRLVRARGGGTKWNWGGLGTAADVVLATGRLNRVVEHNAGDLTAVLQAGVPLAEAQERFAAAGQMLALDPPLGRDDAATVGGIVATADAGPLRHRYGAVRDLVLGAAVALPDGTVARSGGKVIKNVAGYDLAKLFAGSLGALGTIVEVVVRLHPLPAATATVVGETDDPRALERAALDLAAAPLELEALDVRWEAGQPGWLLARIGGVAAVDRAERIASELALGATVETEDVPLWADQRARQRSAEGIVVRVSGLPTELARTIAAAERRGGRLVGRAGLGVWWITLPSARSRAVASLRAELAPFPCVVTDAPAEVRRELDVWGLADEALVRLSRRVKERFDPAGVCSPGVLL